MLHPRKCCVQQLANSRFLKLPKINLFIRTMLQDIILNGSNFYQGKRSMGINLEVLYHVIHVHCFVVIDHIVFDHVSIYKLQVNKKYVYNLNIKILERKSIIITYSQ